MSSTTLATFFQSLVQMVFDYVTSALLSGNVFEYMLVIAVIGGVVSLLIYGIYKIFHPH